MRKRFLSLAFLCFALSAQAQHLSVGMTFQYMILKQVSVASDVIVPAYSYNYYKVYDNRWKFFSAGQSLVIGSIVQVDFKRIYFAIEPSVELNTYDYSVQYPLSPTGNERVRFKTLFSQTVFPVYVGYQFATSKVLRYSVFLGAEPVFPWQWNASYYTNDNSGPQRYSPYDMKNILFNSNPYWNTLVGIGIHFASLGRMDIRYEHRLGSPGNQYAATFNTVGFALTYFIPLNLLKKKIYYE